MRDHREHYLRDIALLLASIGVAILLQQTGALDAMLARAIRMQYLASGVVGAFFTSFLTVIPATAAITELSRMGVPIARLALIGGVGAMLADFLIYLLLREAIAEPLLALVELKSGERLKRFVRRGRHRFIGTLLGAVIVASPLPDELGLLLMGLSRSRWYVTLLTTYTLNVAGIAIVALAARAL